MSCLCLCSGCPRRRHERLAVLLHPPLLYPGAGCAGSDRADVLRPLEGKQAQAFLLIQNIKCPI